MSRDHTPLATLPAGSLLVMCTDSCISTGIYDIPYHDLSEPFQRLLGLVERDEIITILEQKGLVDTSMNLNVRDITSSGLLGWICRMIERTLDQAQEARYQEQTNLQSS